MERAKVKNRAFDRMGGYFAHLIDPDHFMGRTAFDIPYSKNAPPVNISKNGKIFAMEVAVPGFTKDELEVIVKNGVLTIRGEKSKSDHIERSEYILEEFNYNSFERSFRLAENIAEEGIDAVCENGMLKLTFIDVPDEEERSYRKVTVH
ncbi:MAG TPA: Hsp20/alpha crystallin family protein [Saprospiraceae bacterium]|nr:Hsp20/alpha crystallin family protein [Saprospiraceae bacterium]HMP23051.1 Hsp20/alpha crystallin family protein [Saprospiraceae bacterium]